MSEIIAWAVPVFVLLLLVEALADRLRRRPGMRGYEWRDTATSLSLGVANVVDTLRESRDVQRLGERLKQLEADRPNVVLN